MSRLKICLWCIATVVILGACGSRVTVKDPTIPEPLIDKLPLKVAGRYPENFKHFVHEERVIGKEKWSIDLGASNQMLFTQLFSSMFT